MKSALALIGAAALLSAVDLPGVGALPASPSFDCAKSRAADERAIDERLAELDRAIAAAYSQVASVAKDQARLEAKDILTARRACGANRLCILDQQVNGIEAFSRFGSHVSVPSWVGEHRIALFKSRTQRSMQGIPTRVARCAVTKIVSISTRFGAELKPPVSDTDSSGSAVVYASHGGQVSYSYVAPLAESRIGDEVLVCLVSIPKDCPPGDDRGRVYSATNLRTKGSWLLPDAQHMCGGV